MQSTESLPIVTVRGSAATAGPWTLTVTDVIAGDEAATTIAQANEGNPPVPDGLIYVLAKVKADNTGASAAPISLSDFAATGSDGVIRPAVSMAVPTPALQGTVDAGGSLEGWIPLAVDDATSATLWFDSVLLGGTWSQAILGLADGSAIPTFTSDVGDSDAGSDPGNPAGLNEPVRTGDWSVTILRTADGQEVYDLSDYRLQALGQSDSAGTEVQTWLGVYATVTNLSTYPTFFSPNALMLTSTSGEVWDNIMALTPPNPDLSRELLPGATREGWFVFQVQSYVTDRLVRVLPSAVADEPRYVALTGSASTGATTGGSSADDAPLDIAANQTAKVNDSQVNLRAEPRADADIVAELDKDTEITITGDPVEAGGYRWYPVTVVETGDNGYIVQEFIEVSEN